MPEPDVLDPETTTQQDFSKFTPLQMQAAAILELRRREKVGAIEKVQNSLSAFVREGWHILEPSTPLVWNWHIDVICKALEDVTRGECKRLLINVPPGHMKSLLVSVFWPAWEWLTMPHRRFIFATYSQPLTLRDSHRCRELMQSSWYRDRIKRQFGPKGNRIWYFTGDQNAKGFYENKERGFRFSTSVGGAGTGHRGDVVAVDDAQNVEEFPTPGSLEAVSSWWDQRMSSRLNDMATGAFVVIQQRVHENDLAGHLIAMDERNKNNPAWTPYRRLTLASEFDPAMPTVEGDPRTQKDELLFPEKFPRDVIEAAKIQLGPYAFASQHQQQPYPASGGILRINAFRFWYPAGTVPPATVALADDQGNTIPAIQIPLPARFDVEALSWDMAFKDTHGSDYVCGQHWGRSAAKLFLLSQVHARLSFTDTIREFRNMCQAAPRALAKWVEDKANGSAVIDTLKSEIMGIVPVNPKGGKEARAHAASPAIEAGNVYLPHPSIAPWVRDAFLPEIAAFPRGKHDDQVDAMTQAIIEMALSGSDFMSRMTRM